MASLTAGGWVDVAAHQPSRRAERSLGLPQGLERRARAFSSVEDEWTPNRQGGCEWSAFRTENLASQQTMFGYQHARVSFFFNRYPDPATLEWMETTANRGQ